MILVCPQRDTIRSSRNRFFVATVMQMILYRNLQVTMMPSPSFLLVTLLHVLVDIFLFSRHGQSFRA